MLGGFLLLAIVVASLLHMLGLTEQAKRIGGGVFVLAVLAPLLAQCAAGADRYVSGPGLGIGSLVLVIVVGVAGFKRFVDHRRELHHWVGQHPTSLKQRVEDDL